MKAEQNVERTVHQVGKNVGKSLHELSKHPIESTVEFVRGAGDAALADVTFNAVQRPYDSKHPVAYQAGQMVGHAVSTLAGMAETTGFAAVETGGIVLDATGVWAIVGAPATAIAAAGVTHGATLTATGSANFAKSAKELYQRMSRSEGGVGVPSKVTDNPISKNMKTRVPDDEITPPIKRGNAPISKKDKRPIEIHHEGQDPNGPFHEMHASDHRYGDNYKKNHPNYNGQSRIDRKQFRKDVRKYWESEWDRGRFNKK